MKIENLEIKESDGVIILNGKTYRAESEHVHHPFEQNIIYDVEYCKKHSVVVKCNNQHEWDSVKQLFNDDVQIAFDADRWNCIDWCGAAAEKFYSDRGYTIIPASRFISDNQTATVEQAEPKWRESWEVLEFKHATDAEVLYKLTDGLYYWNNNRFNLDSMLNKGQCLANGSFTIHSIRNKQSGEVFTIGDKVIYLGNIKTIKEIIIGSDNNGMWAISDEHVLTKLNLTCYVPYTEPALPTLQEVYKQVNPLLFLDIENYIVNQSRSNTGFKKEQNRLSNATQCKQLQAYIALRNIADYYNGEVGYKAKLTESSFFVEFADGDNSPQVGHYATTVKSRVMPLAVEFKQREHAEYAISILKEAGLLDALKG